MGSDLAAERITRLPCLVLFSLYELDHGKLKSFLGLAMSDTIPTPSWIAHVLPPAIVMLLAAPVAVQPQMYLSDQGDTSSLAFRIWLFTPFWIGLVAAPGYLRAIHLMRKGLGSHAAAAPWIWISVGLGMIA
ncbi:MAG: hypothetical protein OES69_19410, partial [Myxococcales bacterium]|nr:hypothetical protein [Myxococcales bacterium]